MPADPDHAPPREREIALLAVADDPDATAARVARLERLGPYPLRQRAEQRIRDRYVDTPDRSLGRRKLALRLRELDGAPRVTLKADTERHGGAADRFELELPWSAAAFAAVAAELAARDVSLRASAEPSDDPEAALHAAGLAVVQERETLRRPRDVLAPDRGSLLAELAVDSVTFRLAAGAVRVVEVELEARAEDAALEPLAELVRRAAPALEPWPTAKLALGLALERALAAGTVSVRPDGTLPPEAYEVLRDA